MSVSELSASVDRINGLRQSLSSASLDHRLDEQIRQEIAELMLEVRRAFFADCGLNADKAPRLMSPEAWSLMLQKVDMQNLLRRSFRTSPDASPFRDILRKEPAALDWLVSSWSGDLSHPWRWFEDLSSHRKVSFEMSKVFEMHALSALVYPDHQPILGSSHLDLVRKMQQKGVRCQWGAANLAPLASLVSTQMGHRRLVLNSATVKSFAHMLGRLREIDPSCGPVLGYFSKDLTNVQDSLDASNQGADGDKGPKENQKETMKAILSKNRQYVYSSDYLYKILKEMSDACLVSYDSLKMVFEDFPHPDVVRNVNLGLIFEEAMVQMEKELLSSHMPPSSPLVRKL